MKKSFLFLLIISLFLELSAQTTNLSTPYGTIFNHLDYLQDENYNPAQSSKSINPTILKGKDA